MRFEYVNNSKSGDVYTPFLMATGMILSNDKFSDIKVENGQVVNDGKQQYRCWYGYARPSGQPGSAEVRC